MTISLADPLLAGSPTDLFIDGAWTPARSGRRAPVLDPATEEVLAEVPDGGVEDALAAVEAASTAQAAWARTPPRERADVLMRAFDLMVERTESLALLMTLEMGKPLAESRGEVAYAAEFFRWFAEEAVRIDGGYAVRPDGLARNLVMRQPVGPCLLITPWNFPLAMATRKLGPALAAGCTSVLKPAMQTPLSALALAGILAESGLPPGVVNVVTTTRAGETVTAMLATGQLRKLSFTGSTGVGRLLLGQAAQTVMRTSMELGGNAPFLVLPDADLDLAVDAAMAAKMRNMGEACTAANRFFVHDSVADAFSVALVERMSALTVGHGRDPDTDVGPMVDAPSRAKIWELVDGAVADGAALVTGGGRRPGPGFFVDPTVLTGVRAQSAITSTEIFGPVAAVQRFSGLDDVLVRANRSDYGLVGYVITQDLDVALEVSERLEVGMVGINTGVVSTPSAPFGGVKQSGVGREGGRVGIEEYLETKYVSLPVRRPTRLPGREAVA